MIMSHSLMTNYETQIVRGGKEDESVAAIIDIYYISNKTGTSHCLRG